MLRRLDPHLAGILSLSAGAFAFTLQDFIIKAVSGEYSLSQVLATRCLVAFPLLLLLVGFEGGWRRLATRRPGLHLLRTFLLMTSYTAYYLAIAVMPLAQAVALFYAAPLFIVLLARPILGEKIAPAGIAAILFGFLGVIVISDPRSAAITWTALFSIASAATYGLAQVLARRMAESEPAAVMAFYQNAMNFAASSLLGILIAAKTLPGPETSVAFAFLLRPWILPPLPDLMLIAATGICAAAGSWLLTQAYRLAPANVVAPFEYSAMIWATAGGILIWQEIPNPRMMLGIALIVGAGLFVLRRGKARPR